MLVWEGFIEQSLGFLDSFLVALGMDHLDRMFKGGRGDETQTPDGLETNCVFHGLPVILRQYQVVQNDARISRISTARLTGVLLTWVIILRLNFINSMPLNVNAFLPRQSVKTFWAQNAICRSVDFLPQCIGVACPNHRLSNATSLAGLDCME